MEGSLWVDLVASACNTINNNVTTTVIMTTTIKIDFTGLSSNLAFIEDRLNIPSINNNNVDNA